MHGLDAGKVKRETGDNGDNTATELSSLRSSMEMMMENINHLVTKQQAKLFFWIINESILS